MPGDDHMARHGPLPLDDPGAAGRDSGKAVSSDGPPDSSPAHPDSALRTERIAYHVGVNAVYRQYAIDHVNGLPEGILRMSHLPKAHGGRELNEQL
jgi:hypothetical protein